MKNNITRIYDKNKFNSRRKYVLNVLLVLVLLIAIYFAAFSKAEAVIPIEYINYYTLESFDSSIEVESDLKGNYIIFPEVVNNRKAITYYVEEVIQETVESPIENSIGNIIETTVVESTNIKEYKPNDTYYIDDAKSLSIKVEYGEVVKQLNDVEEQSTQTSNTIVNNTTTSNVENNTIVTNTIEVPSAITEENVETSTTEDNEETTQREVVYLGEIGQEGEEGTLENPYRTITQAINGLKVENEDGTTISGTIKILEIANISNFGTEKVDNILIEGYNENSVIKMLGDWELTGNTTITNIKLMLDKENLSIYGNGYDLVLGTEENKESIKIDGEYYPNVYGGSRDGEITKTNVTIHSGIYESIYGGSQGYTIIGNTNLDIRYAIVNTSLYGGSYHGNIEGNVNTIIQNGIYNNTETKDTALSGGCVDGNIKGNVNFTISGGIVRKGTGAGHITGAAGTNNLSGDVNLTINNISLGDENGNGNNKIFGFGATGRTSANKVNITINNIKGTPIWIVGYSHTVEPETGITSTVIMSLNNITNETTIYPSTVDTNVQTIKSTIETNGIQAKLQTVKGTEYENITIANKSSIELVNDERNIVFNGYLTGDGTGTLKLYDNATLTIKGGIEGGSVNIDIEEDSKISNHFVNIFSEKEEQEGELVSVKLEEKDKYNKDYVECISYWKFYNENNGINSNSNYIYLHSTRGADNHEGTGGKSFSG